MKKNYHIIFDHQAGQHAIHGIPRKTVFFFPEILENDVDDIDSFYKAARFALFLNVP